MYYYIVDPGKLGLERFEQLQIELQGLLSEFNVSGEMVRVTTLRNIKDLVDNAGLRATRTLIACGNDDTFNQMLASLQGKNFILGFIPLEPEKSYLATILGLDSLHTAVKTIAARRIERIDMARIGNTHFISYVEFGVTSQNLKNAGWWNSVRVLSSKAIKINIRIDNSYTVEMLGLGGLLVNARKTSSKNALIANPADGLLDLLILEQLHTWDILKYKQAIVDNRLEELPHPTVIKCKTVEFLQPRGFALTMSGRIIAKFPVAVEMLEQKLQIIVGKNRTF